MLSYFFVISKLRLATSMISNVNGTREPEKKYAIEAAIGNAVKVVLVPIMAEAVPAMCPIGDMAIAFIFPKIAPKTKKFGKRKSMTLKMFVIPPDEKNIRKMTAQINSNFSEIFTILTGSNFVSNLALSIDPSPTANAPAPK